MKFIVELLAFGKPGEVREVEVLPATKMPPLTTTLVNAMLQEIFLRGQNEEDPQDHPSVSAGDVIHIGEDRWLVCITGFIKLHQIEYEMWKELPQVGRQRVLLNRESFIHRGRDHSK